MTTDKLRHGKRRNPFTALPNSTLQDSRIGADGLGVLVYLLSLPDDWTFSIKSLSRHFSMQTKSAISLEPLPHGKTSGVDAIKRIMRCLREAGYITLERCHDGTTVYHLYETPLDNPDPENPELVAPSGLSTTPRVDNPPTPRVDYPPGGKSTRITKEYSSSTKEPLTKGERENFSNDQDSETIVDRLIQALEIGNASIVKAEMRSQGAQGVFLPWRLNGKNSNSATNFDRRLLDRVLRHLRATASGNEAMLGDAARWVSLREDTPKGLREINTFWEEAQAIQEPTATPIAHVSTPQSENPLEAARSLYNAIKFAKRSNARNAITARLRAQIEAVRNSGLEVDPEWLEITGESDAA